MFEHRLAKHNWMRILVASLALTFVSAVQAVGVDEPDDTSASVDQVADEHGERERGPRGRRGFGRGSRDGSPDGLRERRGSLRGRRPGAMLWSRMNDEEREEVKAFVGEHFPEMSEQLRAIESEDGGSHMNRRLARMLPEVLRMHKLSQEDRELFEIKMTEHKSRFELRRLVREYRHADDEATMEQLSAKIRPLVEAAFDAKQERMEQEVVRLDKRLSGLRDHIAKRAENRDREIERAFADVLDGKRPEDERFKRQGNRGKRSGRKNRGPVAVPEP